MILDGGNGCNRVRGLNTEMGVLEVVVVLQAVTQ
jgi:hypothetical protein